MSRMTFHKAYKLVELKDIDLDRCFYCWPDWDANQVQEYIEKLYSNGL